MTASLRFGRIAGIPVGANWSALLIAALIAWSLAGRLLPAQVPGLDPAAYWLAGAVGAGLFLGSLLAHEIGHALVARRAGLRVRGITLWLLGGVAQLEDEPATPHDELRVAIVGPAVSMALAIGFGLAALALSAAGGPAAAVAITAWLAVGNTAPAWFTVDAFLRNYVEPWQAAALPLRSFDGQPAGVVTAAALYSVPADRRHIVRAGDVAIPVSALVLLAPDQPVTDLAGRLANGRTVAAVVQGGGLIGLITASDLARTTHGERARAVA